MLKQQWYLIGQKDKGDETANTPNIVKYEHGGQNEIIFNRKYFLMGKNSKNSKWIKTAKLPKCVLKYEDAWRVYVSAFQYSKLPNNTPKVPAYRKSACIIL